ncbi:MAG: fluoride efflux transporter CrcB [Bifidobacteriaceae bacterium]|jgi:CrcB protein|nr:fluoride efflux transporter CrcB [Bifidobacteriaceae bacterium]
MLQILVVGLGGFLGAICRFFITKLFNQFNIILPFGTLVSNIIAAFILGLIVGIERNSQVLNPDLRAFITIGCLGGLSTFSAFSIETFMYLELARYWKAALNIFLNVGVSLLFVILGIILGKVIKG